MNSNKDWYRYGWTLDIMKQSWTENTASQVDFIEKALCLKGNERILDLACGYGRHSLELAKRGYTVVGADITPAYADYGNEQAEKLGVDARFICSDIREIDFENEFDVVLNMADGAIGYLENDEENMKIFKTAARSLKHGGKHFADIMNASYADTHFPCRLWDCGENGLTLSSFEWDKNTRVMLYGQSDFEYGKPFEKPDLSCGNPTRLYTAEEISGIMKRLGMELFGAFADVSGKELTDNDIQMLLCSRKL